jgi:hypothetical protein
MSLAGTTAHPLADFPLAIIVGLNGKIIDYGLNSTFIYLRCFVQDLSTPVSGEGGSEHVPLGASVCQRPPTDNVERFLSILRSNFRRKVDELSVIGDAEADKTGI